ncbi:MAG: hypothetical protein KC910_07090 [Candidatus Eremiobacteraeota bacterium]|nr:hypothetical protein [Candidatus Eremiobacteraeota bacterium]
MKTLRITLDTFQAAITARRLASTVQSLPHLEWDGESPYAGHRPSPAFERWNSQPPANQLADHWSERFLDGQRYVACFEALTLPPDYAYRFFRKSWGAGTVGRVFCVPARARLEPVQGEPSLETVAEAGHPLEKVTGDGQPESYFFATMLMRALRDAGAFWHGLAFDLGDPIAVKPDLKPLDTRRRPGWWERIRGKKSEEGIYKEWELLAELPSDWLPRVEMGDPVVVSYYAHKLYYGERILRIRDCYQPGCYVPQTTLEELAKGPRMVVV